VAAYATCAAARQARGILLAVWATGGRATPVGGRLPIGWRAGRCAEYVCGVADICCSPLTAGQLARAAELAEEFLGGQAGADALAASFVGHPELAIALTIDGTVEGVAFGQPDGEGGAMLEGITVDDAHSAHGLGSLLLARFEKAAADAGCRNVNLGSGGDYVEHFYLKNGYRQTEYLVAIPDGDRQFLDLDGLDVLRERHWEPNRLVLNIAAPEGYSPPVKAALAQRLCVRASEVACIFCKPVTRSR
jgi:GNAT superfamily N-acetyltransferase